MQAHSTSGTSTAWQEPAAHRKKTPGACERCRERRVKCNGCQPCDQCLKRDFLCSYTFVPACGNEALYEKLDLVLSRLDRVEEALSQSAKSWEPVRPLLPTWTQRNGQAQLNSQSGCFEYYGGTSAFVVASSLQKRMRHLDDVPCNKKPSKVRRVHESRWTTTTAAQDPQDIDLQELTGFCDYVVPPSELHHRRTLREDVADRHLDSFFHTIHIFLPLFDEARFRDIYRAVRPFFGDNRLFVPRFDRQNRPQLICLLYAVLALGALYEDEQDDSSSWASWYFVQAQELLGRYLDAINVELVQAAMLMVCDL
jgi:hypothetical protein